MIFEIFHIETKKHPTYDVQNKVFLCIFNDWELVHPGLFPHFDSFPYQFTIIITVFYSLIEFEYLKKMLYFVTL